MFCSICGSFMPQEAPFHSCCTAIHRPLSPYCGNCGGTLRLGFVESVTCGCARLKPDDASDVNRPGVERPNE